MKTISYALKCALCAAPLALVACGGGDSDTVIVTDPDGPFDTTVDAFLQEYSIDLSRDSAPFGAVTFFVTNEGFDMHEFLVVRTDFFADELPIEDDGSYMEDGPGTEVVDLVEDIMPGETVEFTLDLDPGHYVVLCNMVEIEDDGDLFAHYDLGMFADFDVVPVVQ
jgi:hypothetical protein